MASQTAPPARTDGRKILGLDCALNDIAEYAGRNDEMRFPNAIQDWSGKPRTLREKAMMTFMNQITDKSDWPRKIRDQKIVEKWKAEAAEQAKKIEPHEALSERMIDYVRTSKWSQVVRFD